MLARTSFIRHKPSGVSLETPLLIPSISSKGFPNSPQGQSDLQTILGFVASFVTEACLISAYDIAHGYIPAPPDLSLRPELIVLDSGGYELTDSLDLSEVVATGTPAKPWTAEAYRSVLDNWPDELPAMFVSYDHPEERMPFSEQVAVARGTFRGRSQQLHTLLIKPETQTQATLSKALAQAAAHADQLAPFDAIGMTEKELGDSVIERMVATARLRRAMDEAGIQSPIHVFGALDPLSVCLYFLAGAEMFDGLTWVRYAYSEGRCVYIHNQGALKYGLTTRQNTVRTRAMTENLYCLQELSQRLRDFRATGDFAKLEPHGKLLHDAWDTLTTKLKSRER